MPICEQKQGLFYSYGSSMIIHEKLSMLSTIQMSDKWSIFRLEKSKHLLLFYGFYLDANDMETIAYLAFEFRVEFKPTPTLAFNVKSESKELWGKTQEFLLDFELMLV